MTRDCERTRRRGATAILISLSLLPVSAAAKEGRFFVNLGIGNVAYRPAHGISTSSGVIPGSGARVASHASVVLDSGIFIADNWSLAVSSGLPPTVRILGSGTTAGLGELGKATYGSTIILVQRHFPIGRFATPYIGAGPVYSIIFSAKGTGADKLRLSDELGFAVQAGSTFPIGKQYGVFIDMKKTFIRSEAEIMIGQERFVSQSKPSPLTVSGGVSYRF